MKNHSCSATQISMALGIALLLHSAEAQQTAQPSQPAIPAASQSSAASLQLPLEFEANRGQAPAPYAFVAHGPAYSLALSASQVTLSLRSESHTAAGARDAAALSPGQSSQLSLRLVGASETALLSGLEPRPGRSNYFIGNDPSKWLTGVPHFGRVSIANAYPGIDLVFYGNPRQLEYDFIIAPGADPNLIHLNALGAISSVLNEQGNLILRTNAGDVELKHPVAYQDVNGKRNVVSSAFRPEQGNLLAFTFGNYDRQRPLIVDPELIYAAAIGGSNWNQGIGMDVDAEGNAYITGNSCSTDFPTTAGSPQENSSNPYAASCEDAFVLKLNPTASTLLYSDFVGGSGISSGTHIAVDDSGNAYVTGATSSANFPLISNIGPSTPRACALFKPFDTDCMDGFILKLNPEGSGIVFSSLLGGNESSLGFQVKLNPVTGDVVVLGETDSADFLPAPTELEATFGGGNCFIEIPCFNGFLLGLNPTTGSLRYGTFLGGEKNNWATGLAFDLSGNIFVTGSSQPPLSTVIGTPTHVYPPKTGAPEGFDVFVAKLKLAGNKLTLGYLTLIQGDKDSMPTGIAVDAAGNAYVAGSTSALHLPVTPEVFQSTNNATEPSTTCVPIVPANPFLPLACGTIFVGKINPSGALSFLTYAGGNKTDWGQAIGVDSVGNIWLTGNTSSNNFPFSTGTHAPFASSIPYLAELSNNGAKLLFAAPIASFSGQSTDLRIDKENNVYVTGYASQAPSTPGVYPPASSNISSLFIQKWGPGAAPTLKLSSTSLTFPVTVLGAISAPQTVTAKNTGAGTLNLAVQPVTFGFVESNNCGASLAPGASCTITATFEPQPASPACPAGPSCYPQNENAAIVIQSNDINGQQSIELNGITGKGPVVTTESVAFPAQAPGTTGPTQYLQIENIGDLDLVLANTSITGPDAADFQVSAITQQSRCAMLPPATFCSVGVTFSPRASATGTRTATLNLFDNAPNSPQSIPLTATAFSSAPALTVSPTTVTIGPVIIGGSQGGFYASLILTNPSTKAVAEVTAVTFEGANKADFSVEQGNGFPHLPVYILPGESGFIPIAFNPASGAHGLREATLKLTTNPALPGLPVIQLQGLAAASGDPSPQYFLVPNPLNFGSMPVSQSSSPESMILAIQNNIFPCADGKTHCGGPLDISSITAGLPDYTLSTSPSYNVCKLPPIAIPHGTECWYFVNFAPAEAGNRDTSLAIKSNSPWGSPEFPLIGTGLALPIATPSTTSLNFGPSPIKVRTLPLLVTLTNTGTANLTVTSATASTDFVVVSNSCTAPLAPKISCTIGVAFTPPAAGAFSGTLTITGNIHSGKQLVALSGSGTNSELLRISPSAITFGTQAINTASKPQNISITNVGDAPVTFPAKAFRVSENFAFQSTTCPTTLAERASCTVSVVFKPTTVYLVEGTLTLTDSALGSPQQVTLTGNLR